MKVSGYGTGSVLLTENVLKRKELYPQYLFWSLVEFWNDSIKPYTDHPSVFQNIAFLRRLVFLKS
jgi:hypothetical protein